MHKKIAISRIFVCVLLLLLTASLVVSFVAPSLAYFQTIFTSTGYNSAKIELIFDTLDFTDPDVTAAGYANEDAEGNAIPWGTEKNPYVISEKYHVQNLSVLQNNGFFEKETQAFFLVCKPDGSPVAIDCEGMRMAPVGTHANPFTGVIKGAFVTGETEYKSDKTPENGYGVSTSTIANLTVSASADEPDIGFFGYVGYEGTLDNETNPDRPTVQGYSAEIRNLMLADVTIESNITFDYVLNELVEKWWSQFPEHTRSNETTDQDHQESHHVGIVAGHATFAVIEDISVFYSSEAVSAFSLADSGEINYYSITGLVGMLEHVNPDTQDGNMIGGAGSGVTDGDTLVEGGFGGGGSISGSLTGYMMAETLFNEHESTVGETDIGDYADPVPEINPNGIYDVTDMWKHNPKYNVVDAETGAKDTRKYISLFQTVTMTETLESGGIFGDDDEIQTNYYVFKDTVFTFAMSASSRNPGHVDHVQKIWKSPDSVKVSTTANKNNFQLQADTATDRSGASYKFTALTSDQALEEHAFYILTYHDAGGDGWEDDKFFVLPINARTTNGEYEIIYASDFCDQNGELLINTPNAVGTPDTGFYLASAKSDVFEHAYQYTASKTFVDPITKKAFSVSSQLSSILQGGWGYSNATPTFTDATSTTDNSIDYEWSFDYENGKFAVYNQYAFSGRHVLINYTKAGRTTIDFHLDNGVAEFQFDHVTEDYGEQTAPDAETLANYYLFNIYKVEKAAALEPKNLFVTGTPAYEFNPSEYVFENDGNGGYTLAPIRSYNLNSGKGKYLTQLNHIVKLSKQTDGSYSLKLSQNPIFNWIFGDSLDTNSGGVVNTEIGTTGQYVTIPSGMISFYISEASVEDPSYINIIVAVNPEQVSNGTVGFWKVNTTGTSFNFDITDPDDSFNLPISKSAANESDKKYILTVSKFKSPVVDENGNHVIDEETGQPKYQELQDADGDAIPTYVYLGGEVAFVYHSFEITQSGFYFLGSGNGPLSVSYFSVSGAAGAGADGSSASPLGNIDFVYANNGDIVTVDKKFEGIQNTAQEDYSLYYPTYHFVMMLPKNDQGVLNRICNEEIKIYRFIGDAGPTGTKRHIRFTFGSNYKATIKGLADLYEDVLEIITPTS